MARGRTQIANLLLASIRNFDLKIPNSKVAWDGLTADHTDHPHAVTNVWQMWPMTESNTFNSPIRSQFPTDGLLSALNRVVINKNILRTGTTPPHRTLNTINTNRLVTNNLLFTSFHSKSHFSNGADKLDRVNV